MRDAISRLDMREKSIPQRITVIFFFFFFKLSKKNIYLFFFFMVMVNLGSTDDSRYTGYREITDRDVLDLQCIEWDLLCDPRNTLGVGLGGGAGSKIKFFTTWSCGIFIFDVTLLYLM